MTHESEKGQGGGIGPYDRSERATRITSEDEAVLRGGQAGWVLARITKLEGEIHKNGWDGPPTLWFLYRDGTWFVVPKPVPNPPAEALEILSHALSLPMQPFRGALNRTVRNDPVAVVFVCKAWENHDFSGPEERAADGRALADIPGSVEIRAASAVDLDGGQYWVTRVRGSEPEVRYIAPGDTKFRVGGRVYESLERIARTLRQKREEMAA